MAAAGRLAPLVVRPDRTVTGCGTPAGPRLGTTEGALFAAVDVAVPDGSVLVFTSDLRLTSYLAGPAKSLSSAPDYHDRPLQELCDALVYGLPAELGAGNAAVIVARTRSFPRTGSWPLDSDPAAVAVARSRTGRQLAAWGVDDETAFNTELIVSELVTNAVRYGSPRSSSA